MTQETNITAPRNETLGSLSYVGGALQVEGVPIDTIAREVGTPVYVYSQRTLESTYQRCAHAFSNLNAGIFYAMKANHNQSVLGVFAALGAGIDIVSIGEAYRALAAGIPASRIIYSGVGKTAEDLAQALNLGLYQINVESANELEVLNLVALRMGRRAPVAIRVNPDVDAKTMKGTTTGKKGNKFGVDIADALPVFQRAATLPGIQLLGLAVHIGSQITSIEPFRLAYAKTVEFWRMLRDRGIVLPRLDLGGGIGVWYRDEDPADFESWADVITEATAGLDVEICVAPGRALVAHSGILVTTAVYNKRGNDRRFLILDAGMNDLARPSLYGAYHHIIPVKEPVRGAMQEPFDIVGPVCESTDAFAAARMLYPIQDGDVVAFLSAGAYGAAMSSTYNSRPLIPEVLVNGSTYAVVRPRPTIQTLIDAEPMAPWLAGRGSDKAVGM
jgi:diaminopimelate decarboxylase